MASVKAGIFEESEASFLTTPIIINPLDDKFTYTALAQQRAQ